MIKEILLLPPLVFGIYLLTAWLISALSAKMSHVPTITGAKGKYDAYACGEEVPSEKQSPDYTLFFPFAIFFTLMHVAGLMLATLAISGSGASYQFGVIYLAVIGAILAILYAR